jgi:GNAT superfamily N-acetyltransferase
MSRADSREPPTPAASEDIEFRAMRLDDIDSGLRLCRLSGWDQVARDWEHFLAVEPPAAGVAIRSGTVIGTVAPIRYGAGFAWIGMVLVDPSAQGQGLGTSLVNYALDALRDVAAVRLDATPAGHPLYLKHGFADEGHLRRMECGSANLGPHAHPEIRPMTSGDLSDVIAMDLEVFGAPRAPLLEWMFAGAPEYAVVSRRDGRLGGYLFGRHGHQFGHLGPIVAVDDRLAQEMTASCLSRHRGRAFIVDAMSHSGEWTAFLEQAGFREQRPFIRMHRGGQPPFGLPRQQFAVLGPEFG